MAEISTGLFPQNLRPGIRMWHGAAYKTYNPIYDKILDVQQASDRAYEEDVMMSNLGLAAIKTQGGAVTYDSGNQLWSVRYNHVQYGLGFAITQEMMEDGVALKVGQKMAESLKLSMLRTREIISASVYYNGFSAPTTTEGGDGVAIFANNHPTPGGNFSNVPVTPASLSEASIEQMVIDTNLFKDNRGQIIQVVPQKIIVHPNNQFVARRVLGSYLRSGSADNDINAVRSMGILSDSNVVVDPYLTSTTNWFVKTDQPGLNYFNRKDLTLDDDNEFDTNNMKFKGLFRASVGCSDPRAGYGVNA